MKMVRINDEYTVMPDQIAELHINRQADRITVRMKSGLGIGVGADYGKGIYATHERLLAEINNALES